MFSKNHLSIYLFLILSLITGNLLAVNDTIPQKNSLKEPAFSGARDSVIEDFSGGRRIIYYFGDVQVKYQNLELKAAYMEYDLDKKVVFARGEKDSLGKLVGKPVMREGNKTYTMEEVSYNFDTKKARITNMITQESEGFLHGTRIKKMADNSFNISNAKYTTCDLDHPHFYLKMPVAKVVSGTNPVTVFGPAYFVLEDVPTPFFLPFGFVPKISTRSSGVLFPTFGEEIARGFFMRGLGYYFVISDNFDVTMTGDIYSLGSWNAQLNTRYKKRYKYDGNLSFNLSNNQTGEPGSTDFFQSKDFSFQWSHSQDSKARPGTSFRASVNLSTPMNNRYNSNSLQNSLQNQISSSISYSRTWEGTPFSFSTNILHSQNSLDSSYTVTFPNFRFDVRTIYPFRKENSSGKRRFYEDISFGYNTAFDNKVSFKASQVSDPDFLSLFRSGMRHNFALGLPSFNLFRYIVVSPSISYGMNWYFQKNQKIYDEESNRVVDNFSKLFDSFGATHEFSGGLSANTRIYGIFNFGNKGSIQKIRHMITPSVGFSFRPEMGTSWNGYTSYSYVDINGIQHTIDYNKYSGQINSPPSPGKSAAMSFSLGNNIEAKFRDKNDTSGKGSRIVKIIDNLSFGGSYNFLADSMNLSSISAVLSTTIFGKLGLSANAILDPYAVDYMGRRINKFNIVQMGGLNLARITNGSLSFSYQFSGGENKKGKNKTPPPAGPGFEDNSGSEPTSGGVHSEELEYTKVYYHPVTGEYIPGGWLYYLAPNIPWSINFNYSFSYNKSYTYQNEVLKKNHNTVQTLGISAQVNLTKSLNFNINTGVDLNAMKLTTTQLSASYDLHCFMISFGWVPQGKWQSWNFRINAKASALQDLLQYKKNASYWDN